MVRLMIIGLIIGIANTIPGVSGGTMAVILKIYDKLIFSISNLRTDFINSCKTLIPIGIGGVIGILAFANLIEYTLATFPVATNMLFVGLVVGSIPSVYRNCNEKGDDSSVSSYIIFMIALTTMILMETFKDIEGDALNIYTVLDVKTFSVLFLTSIIAAGTMIIPGISGSFMLLLLGTYHTILASVANLDVMMLIPVALGCIVGVLLFAKIIGLLFEKYSTQTYYAILGLMIGSIYVIFPEFTMNMEFYIGVFLAVASCYAAFWFSKE